MPQTRVSGLVISGQGDPEGLAASLAHVVKLDGRQEIPLGQAWIASANALITCGHVVEPFVDSPSALVVKFPYSGNCYAVKKIELHPSFVRQPDNLVKFDVALLSVTLAQPETNARPLPFAFEQQLKTNQSITTVRYPVHLKDLSAAPEPLAQEGRYLGHLRKHDNFHLLHDLALSSGDSGAPLFDGPVVVAIHCGDTATLPGLNLATTSIRLSLWIDAVRELGLSQSAGQLPARTLKRWLPTVMLFLISLVLAASLSSFFVVPSSQRLWGIEQPTILPVDISFNKPLFGFKSGDPLVIVLAPRSDCWLYLFDIDEKNQVLKLYPPHGSTAFVKAGQARVIDRFGRQLLRVNKAKDKLHIVALISDYPLVSRSDWSSFDPASRPLNFDGDELSERIRNFQKADPQNVLHLVMDAPTAQ